MKSRVDIKDKEKGELTKQLQALKERQTNLEQNVEQQRLQISKQVSKLEEAAAAMKQVSSA